MPRYEWRGAGVFRDNRNDRDIEPGDVVELDAHVAGRQPEFTCVEADTGDSNSDDSDDAVGDVPPFHPEDRTVAEIQDTLDEYHYPEEALTALAEAEREGKNRETALDAIDSARE